MTNLIFGFSRPIEWMPYAEGIMLFDNSIFDHAYCRFHSNSWNCDFIYQSSGHSVNFMGGERFFSKNIAIEEYSLPITKETEAIMGNMMVSRLGLPYGTLEVIGKAIVRIIQFITFQKIKIKNPFKSKNTDCLTEIAYIISNSLNISCPLDLQITYPSEFRDWIKTLPNIERIK